MGTIDIHIDDCEDCCGEDDTPCECPGETLTVVVAGIGNPNPDTCLGPFSLYSGAGDLFYPDLNGSYDTEITTSAPCYTGDDILLGSFSDWGNPGIKVRDIRLCLDDSIQKYMYTHTARIKFCCHGCDNLIVAEDSPCPEGQTRNSVEVTFLGTVWNSDGTRDAIGYPDSFQIMRLVCCTDCFPSNINGCTHLEGTVCGETDPSTVGASLVAALS